MEGYIYKLISPSDKCYIGQTVNFNRRLSDYKNFHHCEKQKKLFNAIKKYGFENFRIEVIEIINIESKKELQSKLNELEILYIKIFDSIVAASKELNISKSYLFKSTYVENMKPKGFYFRKHKDNFSRKIKYIIIYFIIM